MATRPTDIEKESLEAHVELCAIRYSSLEDKVSGLHTRIDKVESLIVELKESIVASTSTQNTQTISIFTSVLGALIAGVIGFISKGIFK